MFERYTEHARRVLFFARFEASQFGSIAIETEHLLLGLIREPKGLTNRVFARSQLSLESIRKEVEGRIVFHEKVATSVEMPFSAEAKRVLQYTAEEADRFRHNYIGTEHLLLGILREERSAAASLLMEKGLRLDTVRQDIVQLLNENRSPEDEQVEASRLSQSDWLTLAKENAQLRARIRELEEQSEIRESLQFRENAYWREREGQAAEGPYCSTCWDIDKRLVRKMTGADGNFYCDYCTHHRLR